MELKQKRTYGEVINEALLIVPYGIETSGTRRPRALASLLIVPYGIETTIRDIQV